MSLIIKNLLISEKSFTLAANGKYSFIASSDLDKQKAKIEIENLFNVRVTKINSSNIKGKVKISRGHFGKRNDNKKFIFTLQNNQKIDLFDIEEKEKGQSKTDKLKQKETRKFIKDDKAKSQINRGRQENDPTALSMQGGGK